MDFQSESLIAKKVTLGRFKKNSQWGHIKKYQNESILKATYIWFIIVPISVNFFSKLEDPLQIITNTQNYEFSLTLPFSWQILFLASFFFIIANIIFRLYAPWIIQEFDHYADFQRKNIPMNFIPVHLSKTTQIKLIVYYRTRLGKHAYNSEPGKGGVEVRTTPMNDEELLRVLFTDNAPFKKMINERGLFYTAYQIENTHAKSARFIALAFLVSALILTLIVTTQNLYSVLSYTVLR